LAALGRLNRGWFFPNDKRYREGIEYVPVFSKWEDLGSKIDFMKVLTN
jgi:hypothetical protein